MKKFMNVLSKTITVRTKDFPKGVGAVSIQTSLFENSNLYLS